MYRNVGIYEKEILRLTPLRRREFLPRRRLLPRRAELPRRARSCRRAGLLPLLRRAEEKLRVARGPVRLRRSVPCDCDAVPCDCDAEDCGSRAVPWACAA